MLRGMIAAALADMIEEILIDEEFLQTVADQMRIDLTPYNDDGETEADTYRLCVYLKDGERWSPSVRLLDLIHDQFDGTLAHPDSSGRDGYDKVLEGFVAELAECLALVEQVLKAERIKGIRNGDWSGSTKS